MKIIYITLSILLITLAAQSQTDRSKAPTAAAARQIEFGKPASFLLPNGLRVLVVENHKRPIISFTLSLDYTPFSEDTLAGNKSVAGELLKCGTKSRSKAAIDEEIDFIGGTLSTTDKGVSAFSLSKHKERVMTLVSDIVLNPTFPTDALENIKNQRLTELMASKEEPSAIGQNIIRSVLYGSNHPYGEITTAKTMAKISQKSCRNFYSTYFRPNIATMVIVGDITPSEAEKLTKKFLGKWKADKVPTTELTIPKPLEANKIVIGIKNGANQTSINLTYSVDFKQNSEDRIKARVMDDLLGGGSFQAKLFQNLREKHAFTYGAYSDLRADKYIGNFTASSSVRAEITDSAFIEIMHEMTNLTIDTVSKAELQLVKNSIIGSFGRSMEEPSTIAQFELNILRYNLPADFYSTYLQKVEAVTQEEVKTMAQKYLKPNNALLVAVGDSATITPLLKKISKTTEIEYYDFEGKRIEK